MQIYRSFLVLGVTLVSLALCGPAHAKRSKKLEIPEIPDRFRDAPAVVLSDASSTHLRPHEHITSHWRKRTILIQSEAGLDAANQVFVYDASKGRLKSFEARIYPPSGGKPKKVASKFVQEIDAVSVGRREIRGEVKVAFPGVEVGSVIEWEAKWYHERQVVVLDWRIQERYPRLKTTYFLAFYGGTHGNRVFRDTIINYSTSSPEQVKEHCKLENVSIERKVQKKRMTCLNVPAWKSEEGAPPASESRMSAQLSFAADRAESRRAWSAKRFHERAASLLESSPVVRDALKSLETSPLWSQDKIRAVDDWVRENIRVESERDCRFSGGTRRSRGEVDEESYCRSAGEVIRRGSGDAFELAFAEYALLKEAGFNVALALSSDRSEGWLDLDLPASRWQHPVLVVRTTDRTWRLVEDDVLIDVGCASCLPDETRWEVSGKGSVSFLAEPPDGKGFMLPAPRPSENVLDVRDAVRAHDPERPLEGLACWKEQLGIARRERLLAAETEGDADAPSHAQLLSFAEEGVEFTELSRDQRGTPYCVAYVGKEDGLAQSLGDRTLFSAPALLKTWSRFPSGESRRLPVDLGYPRSLSYERTLRVPEGAMVEDLPEPLTLQSPFVRFEGEWQVEEPTKIKLTARIEILKGRVPATAYSKTARFFLDLRTWLDARVIVRMTKD